MLQTSPRPTSRGPWIPGQAGNDRAIRLNIAILGLLLLSVMACSRKPIQSSGTLPPRPYEAIVPQEIPKHEVATTYQLPASKELKSWNQKAGQPTFGLIPAFYQLPVAMPAGAIEIQRAQVFGASYESFKMTSSESKPFAILPASVEQTQVFSQVLNQFLDMGIRMVEVSMADANRVMRAEQKMIVQRKFLFPKRTLPSGVDLLVSIQSGEGLYGPVYVGRVISTKDGRLLALATEPNVGPTSLAPVFQQLVSSALRRLADVQ